MENAGLDKAQPGIQIIRRNINSLIYSDDTTLITESQEELKSLLMKIKEEDEKTGLKQHSKNEDHGIWAHHFMANDGGTMETVTDFIFLSSKITMGSNCSHEIKRLLVLGRKAMMNLDSVLKPKDITFATKVLIVKATLFFQ